MHLPWINLIPSKFGTFCRFDLSQDFYWSGRISNYSKIAISRNYAVSYPDYVLTAGNHNVRPDLSEPEEKLRIGFPMLHLPVRSVERARYKAANALGLQRRKHNQLSDEGHHHKVLKSKLDGQTVSDQLLVGLACDYGCKQDLGAIDPEQAGFPKISLLFSGGIPCAEPADVSSADLRRIDKDKEWQQVNMPRDAKVFARVDDGTIRLLPQSIFGDQTAGPPRFARLPDSGDSDGAAGIRFEDMVDGFRLSLMPPPVNVFSAWTNLVPSLGMLFSFLKPRRYVELGVHNGMSFFFRLRVFRCAWPWGRMRRDRQLGR